MAWIPQPTQDGSYTFFSQEFGEAFHSYQGAKAEAFQKFADATDLQQKAQQSSIILDVCYGLGYNTAAAIEAIRKVNAACNIEIYGLELDPTVPIAAATPELLQHWSTEVQTVLKSLAQHHQYQQDDLRATLLIGDARQTIEHLIQANVQADAIFFDPFSPRRCPQLWTIEFFQQVAQCLAPTGKLSTYSRSASVRAALLQTGLAIGTIPIQQKLPHEWSAGTIAAWNAQTLVPLSPMEIEHLQTRAAIPYRDPTLRDSAAQILARHAEEQRSTKLESTSSWRRRWGIA